jgi:glycosyltransferase involved in cell wall biosynthesis
MINSNPPENRPLVHVIYEYGADYRPHSSPFLRLIRPLSHPLVQAYVNVSFGLDYDNEPADLVIIDRLWRRDVSMALVQALVNRIRLRGSRIIYSLDDNFFDLAFDDNTWPDKGILSIVSFLLRQADAVLVTTPALSQRLIEYNPNIHVLANQLDERLLVIRHPSDITSLNSKKPIVIGYMGTFTHDDDFMMVLPALKSIHQRYPGRIELQVVGVVNKEQTKKELQSLPVRYIYPKPEEHEYPLFMLWFTGHIQWDIAISPLDNTPFNNCKSDIKFLDYTSIGAAGIFSQSPAYSSTVHHQQNGWITENTTEAWESALEILILDPNLRVNIAQNAARYLYKERVLANRAPDWVDFINSQC